MNMKRTIDKKQYYNSTKQENLLQFKKETRYQHGKHLAAMWNIKEIRLKIKIFTTGRQCKSEIQGQVGVSGNVQKC